MSRLTQNFFASSGIVLWGTIATCPLWFYDVSSRDIAAVVLGGILTLTIALTAVRNVCERLWSVLKPSYHKRIRIAYESHGMHTDEKRLGYVSTATIREVSRRANQEKSLARR